VKIGDVIISVVGEGTVCFTGGTATSFTAGGQSLFKWIRLANGCSLWRTLDGESVYFVGSDNKAVILPADKPFLPDALAAYQQSKELVALLERAGLVSKV